MSGHRRQAGMWQCKQHLQALTHAACCAASAHAPRIPVYGYGSRGREAFSHGDVCGEAAGCAGGEPRRRATPTLPWQTHRRKSWRPRPPGSGAPLRGAVPLSWRPVWTPAEWLSAATQRPGCQVQAAGSLAAFVRSAGHAKLIAARSM